MNEWMHEHWPGLAAFFAGLGVGGSLIKWLVNREFQRLEDRHAGHDKAHDDHESRLRRIEESRVTQSDIDELRMSLMATITNSHAMLSKRMDDVREDIARLTEHLLGRK